MRKKTGKPQLKVPGRPAGGSSGAPVPAGRHAARTPSPARAKVPGRPAGGGSGAPVKPVARKKTVKRKLALGEAVACCAAEALAASLRLAGGAVSDADVLALYWHTADSAEEGATIWATLEAACRWGLAGTRPLSFGKVMPHVPDCRSGHHETRAGLILGADLPGPHAVYQQMIVSDGTPFDARSCWWSWGQPYDPAVFPDAVIEEAWSVTWPS